MELGLRGRACLITGASGGLGGAVARSLAAEGASVLLVGRRMDALAVVADACLESGGDGELRVQTCVADITDPGAPSELVNVCLTAFGRIDVLVNGAGATEVKAWNELTDRDWQQQWDLNVMAPMRLMRAAAPLMAEQGWGRIVNVSSSSGKRPSGMNMAYGVAKAAELSLSRSFADLFAARGVLVNAVTPGPIAGAAWLADGGLADQRAARSGVSREDLLASVAAGLPLGRLATDDEVAAVVVFLCSGLASTVVGAAWSADGGAVPGII